MGGGRRIAGFALILACTAEPEPEYDPVPQECLEVEPAFERINCLRPHFRELTFAKSAQNAVCQADSLQADGVVDDCHLLAHEIGEANLEKQEADAGLALATCGTSCIEGCLHGVMEVFIGTVGNDLDAVIEAVLPLCDDVDHDIEFACIHGVGHGVRRHGFLSLLDAVAACQASDDAHWRDACLGGVYMEQVDFYLPLSVDNLASTLPLICADLEPDPAVFEDCLAAIGEGLMFRTGHDLERSNDLCLRLADADQIAACQHGAEVELDVNERARPIDGDCR